MAKKAAAKAEETSTIGLVIDVPQTTSIAALAAGIDASDNEQVAGLLSHAMSTGGVGAWDIESSTFIDWKQGELYIVYVDGIEMFPDKNDDTKEFEGVSLRLMVNGSPLTQMANADIVFVSTIKKLIENGKCPGLVSVYWNGVTKQPDPKRTPYKILDIRTPKK